MRTVISGFFLTIIIFLLPVHVTAQGGMTWTADGNAYYRMEGGEIVKYQLPENKKSIVVKKDNLKVAGAEKPLAIRSFKFCCRL